MEAVVRENIGGSGMKEKLKKVLQFIANPRLLLCFGLAWIITNGWSYIMLAVGTWLQIGWMIAVASAYLAFLWLPISPEKIVTIAIAMVLLRFLFPDDEKTLGTLRKMRDSFRAHREEKKQAKEEVEKE